MSRLHLSVRILFLFPLLLLSLVPIGQLSAETVSGSATETSATLDSPTVVDDAKARQAEFDAQKTEMDTMLATFNTDLSNIGSPDNPGELWRRVVEANTKTYAAKQASGIVDEPPKTWTQNPLFEGDTGLTIGLGDGFSSAGPKERVNFSTYRDPATIENPTLRGLQAGLNKINELGNSAANKINEFANKVKNSNSFWAKALRCGGFDWAAQFNALIDLEALKEYVLNLATTVAAAAPMALLGAFSPQLAELVKHMKIMINAQLGAEKMDCASTQNMLAGGLNKALWGNDYAKCMADNSKLGIGKAGKACQASTKRTLVNHDSTETNAVPGPYGMFDGMRDSFGAAGNWIDGALGGGPNPDPSSGTPTAAEAAAANAAERANTDSLVTQAGSSNADDQNNAAAIADKNNPLSSIWSSVKDTYGAVTKSELWKNTFGSFKLTANATVEVGAFKFDLMDKLLRTNTQKGYDSFVVAIVDHFKRLMGDTSTRSLQESYTIVRQLTYACRRNEWITGTGKLESLVNIPDGQYSPDKYSFSDQTVDGMSLLLYRAVTEDKRVAAEIMQRYHLQEAMEAMMEYEVACYYRDEFKRLKEEFENRVQKIAQANAGSDGAKSHPLGDTRAMIDDKTARVINRVNDSMKRFVQWIPLYNAVRMPANGVLKGVTQVSGGSNGSLGEVYDFGEGKSGQ